MGRGDPEQRDLGARRADAPPLGVPAADVARRTSAPRGCSYMDALLGRLREAGFSAETTYHAYHVLDAHIFGFSLWQAEPLVQRRADAGPGRGVRADDPRRRRTRISTSTASSTSTEGAHHEVSAFEFGLDLILDGLEQSRSPT